MVAILFLAALVLPCTLAEVSYLYEAQFIIGIPESGRDFNLLRAQFNINAKKVADTKDILITIDPASIKVHNYTGYLFPIPEGIVPLDGLRGKLTPASVSQASQSNLAAELAKPIIVTRDENGTFSNIRHQPGEQYWSLNLKRGALSLFQLNIKSDAGVYFVNESDITGACPSQYLVQTREHIHGHEHDSQPSYLNVTKSRDYKNCVNRTILRHSFFTGITLTDEELAAKNIISNAKFAYNISGTKASGKLLIESASAEGQHLFSIFKPLSGSLAVYTHQRATLLSANDATASASDLPSGTMSCGWQMLLPNVINAAGDKKFTDADVLPDVAAMVQLLTSPDTQNVMKGVAINRIIERMRGAQGSAWTAVIAKAKELGPRHIKLLMDLAPTTGTLESLMTFKGALTSGKLTSNITAQYFAILSLLGEPSFEIVGQVFDICQMDQIAGTLRTRKACLLCFASLVYNRYYRSGYALKNATFPADEKARFDASPETLQGLVNTLLAGNTTLQLLAVKFLGNLGSPNIVETLASVAKDEKYPLVVRVHAVRAFRRVPPCSSKRIQEIVLPIFTDWHNDVELRLSAYRMVMALSPSQTTYDLISAAMHNEHDEQVLSYVYSHLKVLAQNPVVTDFRQSDRARIALSGMTMMIPAGVQYSRYYRFADTYDDDRNAGFFLDMSVVTSSRSLIPREICLWAQGVAFGVRVNGAHACLRLQGLQKMLQGVFRSGGSVASDIFEAFQVNAVEYEEFHGMFDISVQASELQFAIIEPVLSALKEQMATAPADAMAKLNSIVASLGTRITKTIALDSTLQVPSLIGLPIQQNNTYIMYLNLTLGNVSLQTSCMNSPKYNCTLNLAPSTMYRIGLHQSIGVDACVLQSKILLHGMASRDRTDDRAWQFDYNRNDKTGVKSITFTAALPQSRLTTGHTEAIPYLVTVDRTKPIADQFYVREWNAWHASAIGDLNYDYSLKSTAKITGFLAGFNKTKTSCMPFMLSAGQAREPYCGKVIRDFYIIPQPGAPKTMAIVFNITSPPKAAAAPAASFRSADLFDDIRSILDDDDSMNRVNELTEDLQRLRENIDEEARVVSEMEEEMRQDSAASEDFDEDEDEAEDMHHDEFLVRRRRSVMTRKGGRGKPDKNPGRGANRRVNQPASGDSNQKFKVTQDKASYAINIIGWGPEGVRKIELNGERYPLGDDSQKYARTFVLRVTSPNFNALACGNVTVQYPTSYVSMLPGENTVGENKEPKWAYKGKIRYGMAQSCEANSNELEFSWKMLRSDEQKLVTQLINSKSPLAKKYYQVAMCAEHLEKNYRYTWPCRHLFYELNAAHRMEITLEAGDMKKLEVGALDLRKWISAALMNLRFVFWKNLKTSFVRDVKESKKIQFIGERNFQLPLLTNFNITTPESTNQFQNVQLKHGPSSLYFPAYWSAAYHASGWKLPAVCSIQKLPSPSANVVVSTYDNVVYEVPVPASACSTAKVLLSADCSAQGKFAIWGSGATNPPTINIDTAAHKLQIKPADGKPGQWIVNIDNADASAVNDLTSGKIQEYTLLEGGAELALRRDDSGITARLDVGVFVKWTKDGALLVGTSPLYSGLLCGWCGDGNGQAADEYTLASGEIVSDSASFFKSYVAGLCQ